MPKVMCWNPPEAPPAVLIETCAKALKAGQLVGLATESCYFAVADPTHKGGMAKLKKFVGDDLPILEAYSLSAPSDKPLAGASALARRLARRAMPGPVVVAAATAKKGPVVPRYAPNSGSARQLIDFMGRPLSFGTKVGADDNPPVTAAELAAIGGDAISIILDAGKSPFGDFPTVIEVNGAQFSIPIEGVVPAEDLAKQTAWLVTFVCTGNTCRSPMAEAMCKKLLAQKLGCADEELVSRGFRITSMGLSALPGNTATAESLIVAREFKMDLSGHRSRSLHPEMLELADNIIVMTAIHRDSIKALHPNLESVTRLMCGGSDLADPMGSDLEAYRTCAKNIQKHVEKLVTDMVAAGAPERVE